MKILVFLSGVALSAILFSMVTLCFGETSVLAVIQASGSVAIAFSAVTAYRLYKSNTDRHVKEDSRNESSTYLKEARTTIERMYELFSRGDDSLPVSDREVWLSAARTILRYKSLKEKITESDHSEIIEETEEHIRIQLYGLLRNNRESFSEEYFYADEEYRQQEGIEKNSIAVIFDFARWPEGADDPMDNVDGIGLYASGAVPVDFLDVDHYLSNFPSYWERVQERRRELEDKDA